MVGMMCQKCAQNIVSKMAAKYGPTHFLIKFLKEMPWVRSLRPFSTQYFAHIFGTTWHPCGHHFMDPMDTIPPPFFSLPLPLAPLPLRPLWISLPQSSALLPTTGLGSLSEWQHASSSEHGSSVRPKERNSGFDNSGEINRPSLAMPTRMCESEENKHNAKSLD